MALKSDTFKAYKTYERWVNVQQNARIKKLHTDRGGEYLSDKFNAHLDTQGTAR
jgi:hypothetical protein